MKKFFNYVIKTNKMKKRIHWGRLFTDLAIAIGFLLLDIIPLAWTTFQAYVCHHYHQTIIDAGITGETLREANVDVEFWTGTSLILGITIAVLWCIFHRSIIQNTYYWAKEVINDNYSYWGD